MQQIYCEIFRRHYSAFLVLAVMLAMPVGGLASDADNPLFSASYYGDIAKVEQLLASGADVDHRNSAGATGNGETKVISGGQQIAPLRIVSRGDSVHYFVKLADWGTGAPVQTIFVRSGQTVNWKFRWGLMSSDTWRARPGWGRTNCSATVYSKADKRFDFVRQGNQITGYTVELILQRDGNLSTSRIPKSEW